MVFSERKRRHIQYLYHGSGVAAVLGWATRTVLSPLYQREVRYIVTRKISPRPLFGAREKGTMQAESECVTVDSLEALRQIEKEIPSSTTYSLEDLREYVAQGCVIFFIFAAQGEGRERTFVGYSVYQRGVIVVLGRKKPSPFDLFFARFWEMLPEYRGRRYSAVLRETRDEYCRRHGVKFLGGTVAPDNRPSLRSSLVHSDYQIVGTAERVSFLRGLLVWETPWEQIEEALQEFIQREAPD